VSGQPPIARTMPSELKVADTWDKCIENTLRKVSYGTLAGAVISLVLFRGTTSRCSVLFFGSGIGAGIGYTECRNEFEALEKPTPQTLSQ